MKDIAEKNQGKLDVTDPNLWKIKEERGQPEKFEEISQLNSKIFKGLNFSGKH